jgi:hypothetical protein
MRRLVHVILVAVPIVAGCGGSGGDAGPTRSPDLHAVTARQFSMYQVGTRVERPIRRRLGPPSSVSRPQPGIHCLDYPALDERSGRIDPSLTYRFCFDGRGKLTVRTTVVVVR